MHPAAARRDPDLALLERLLAAGPVAHVTLAPELARRARAVDALVARGIVAACGHTDAKAEEAHAAFDRGATHVTHLFNAMRPFAHRDPGIAGAALARDDVTVELILDGNHVADETRAAPGARARPRRARHRRDRGRDARATATATSAPSRSRCATASRDGSTASSPAAC